MIKTRKEVGRKLEKRADSRLLEAGEEVGSVRQACYRIIPGSKEEQVGCLTHSPVKGTLF